MSLGEEAEIFSSLDRVQNPMTNNTNLGRRYVVLRPCGLKDPQMAESEKVQ